MAVCEAVLPHSSTLNASACPAQVKMWLVMLKMTVSHQSPPGTRTQSR
jgi:hypothetical protein